MKEHIWSVVLNDLSTSEHEGAIWWFKVIREVFLRPMASSGHLRDFRGTQSKQC
jgi:hypothetical protein